jgi:hypothetical protein
VWAECREFFLILKVVVHVVTTALKRVRANTDLPLHPVRTSSTNTDWKIKHNIGELFVVVEAILI